MLSVKTKVKIELGGALHIRGTVTDYDTVGVDIKDQNGNRVFIPWFSVIKVVEETEASW